MLFLKAKPFVVMLAVVILLFSQSISVSAELLPFTTDDLNSVNRSENFRDRIFTTTQACSLDISAGNATKEELYQNAWNYLTDPAGIGLSPEAAAGIMGNLDKESAGTMDPQIVQFSANFPDNRSPELPIDEIRGKYGYGIAQWTYGPRQDNLIAYASETNRSSGDLGLQLDFLLKELSESYVGVKAVLEDPDVTIERASDVFLLEFERPAAVLPPPRGTAESKAKEIADRRERGVRIFNTYSNLPAGSFKSSTCAAGINGSVIVDMESADTSAVPCAPGTEDAGITQGYRRGEETTIRLCNITVNGRTSRVNSQLSGPLLALFNTARGSGVPLELNGIFRDMDGQIGIYTKWCSSGGITPTPPPYPKASYSDYTRCPGGAPPGYSNHQMGLAIDFNCDGSLIPQSYSSAQLNECFQWLVSNAGVFGLFELGKGENRNGSGYEGWHWSVDGR